MRFARYAFVALMLLFFAPIASHSGLYAEPQKKTVHVKEYKRKDGTTVKAHDRKPPKSKGTAPAPASSTPKAAKGSSGPARSDRCEECDRDSKGRILRSKDSKKGFMKATGYSKGRPGYVVDHIKPLACGGPDLPSNMQWQTAAEAKAKDKTERAACQ